MHAHGDLQQIRFRGRQRERQLSTLAMTAHSPMQFLLRSDSAHWTPSRGVAVSLTTQSLASGLHEALKRTCLRPPNVETHTNVLPHALAHAASAVPEAAMRIERAIGAADAAQVLFDLAKRLGAKMTLRDIGMPESGIDKLRISPSPMLTESTPAGSQRCSRTDRARPGPRAPSATRQALIGSTSKHCETFSIRRT